MLTRVLILGVVDDLLHYRQFFCPQDLLLEPFLMLLLLQYQYCMGTLPCLLSLAFQDHTFDLQNMKAFLKLNKYGTECGLQNPIIQPTWLPISCGCPFTGTLAIPGRSISVRSHTPGDMTSKVIRSSRIATPFPATSFWAVKYTHTTYLAVSQPECINQVYTKILHL